MTRWHCWPKKHAAPASLKAAVAPARRARRLHRVAHAAISKPAVVGWFCIAVGGGMFIFAPTKVAGKMNTAATDSALDVPAEFFWLPPGPPVAIEVTIIGPAELLPDVPTTPQPVPEPGSLALLATALAALAIIRGRI